MSMTENRITDGEWEYHVIKDILVPNYGILGGMLRVVIVKHPFNEGINIRLGNRRAAVARLVWLRYVDV